MISLSKQIFMKEVVLSWVLKGLSYLMGREGDGGRAFQKERMDQPKQRLGVQRVHGMFRGYEYPTGARIWGILGGYGGQVVDIKWSRKVGPDNADHELQAREFISQC